MTVLNIGIIIVAFMAVVMTSIAVFLAIQFVSTKKALLQMESQDDDESCEQEFDGDDGEPEQETDDYKDYDSGEYFDENYEAI